MRKEITINFSYTEHEFLVRFFEDGHLAKWETFTDSREVGKAISAFYFGESTPSTV